MRMPLRQSSFSHPELATRCPPIGTTSTIRSKLSVAVSPVSPTPTREEPQALLVALAEQVAITQKFPTNRTRLVPASPMPSARGAFLQPGQKETLATAAIPAGSTRRHFFHACSVSEHRISAQL